MKEQKEQEFIKPGYKVNNDTVIYTVLSRGNSSTLYFGGQTIKPGNLEDLYHGLLVREYEPLHRYLILTEELEIARRNFTAQMFRISRLEEDIKNLKNEISGKDFSFSNEKFEVIKQDYNSSLENESDFIGASIRPVAIKFFYDYTGRPNYELNKISFEKEMEILPLLSGHSNIVNVYFTTKDRYGYFMVEEFVEGRNLEGLIKDQKRLEDERFFPFEVVLAVGIGIAKALEYCHSKDIVHRDICPNNILLSHEPKLIDFGVATRCKDCYKTNEIVGTPEYMSRSQIEGYVSKANDLYMLAATLYHLATGEKPFLFTGDLDELAKIKQRYNPANRMRKYNPNIPREFEDILAEYFTEEQEGSALAFYEKLQDLFYKLYKNLTPSEVLKNYLNKLKMPLESVNKEFGKTIIKNINS